jgi:hypothetical protein
MLATMKLLCLNNAINGANIHTLVGVEMTFALNAFVSVDFENYITFENGLGGTYRFASCTRNAII